MWKREIADLPLVRNHGDQVNFRMKLAFQFIPFKATVSNALFVQINWLIPSKPRPQIEYPMTRRSFSENNRFSVFPHHEQTQFFLSMPIASHGVILKYKWYAKNDMTKGA